MRTEPPSPLATALARLRGSAGRLRVVGVALERGDLDVHPGVQREGGQQGVELGPVVGAVQAQGPPGRGPVRRPGPQPDEMASPFSPDSGRAESFR